MPNHHAEVPWVWAERTIERGASGALADEKDARPWLDRKKGESRSGDDLDVRPVVPPGVRAEGQAVEITRGGREIPANSRPVTAPGWWLTQR